MGFACRCVVWGRVRGVLMGFACRCVVWGRVMVGYDGFCLQVCCVGQGEGGL